MLGGWITYDDRLINMEEMSHQHMSNIYHFINTIVPHLYPDCVREDITNWLVKRFGGIILPYNPHPDFHQERAYLKMMGYLNEKNEIVVNNQYIGRYENS
jgi:hypothetical protein